MRSHLAFWPGGRKEENREAQEGRGRGKDARGRCKRRERGGNGDVKRASQLNSQSLSTFEPGWVDHVGGRQRATESDRGRERAREGERGRERAREGERGRERAKGGDRGREREGDRGREREGDRGHRGRE
ncbi:unnamed protein product [Closterium sp. NIES-64]|nr:unnamed protein product [Closterium sp. NIES-64]